MKRIAFYILFLFCLSPLRAQDLSTAFMNMPKDLLPHLEDDGRKALVDMYLSDKDARLQNKMGGFTSLKKLTSDYIFLQLTERSTLEMKMLPLVNDTHIICQVETMRGPVADSKISFFTMEWKPLDSSEMLNLVPAEWFIREDADKKSFSYIESVPQLDMVMFQFKLSPEDNTLTQIYTTPEYLDKETQKKLKPILKDKPKVYTWNQSKFE